MKYNFLRVTTSVCHKSFIPIIITSYKFIHNFIPPSSNQSCRKYKHNKKSVNVLFFFLIILHRIFNVEKKKKNSRPATCGEKKAHSTRYINTLFLSPHVVSFARKYIIPRITIIITPRVIYTHTRTQCTQKKHT